MSSKRHRGDPATRRAILDCALSLMEEGGAAAFRVAAIARAAGISRQAVYLHFGDRAGLLDATVRHVHSVLGVEAHIAALDDAVEPVAALEMLFALRVKQVHEVYPVLLAVQRLLEEDEVLAAAWSVRRGRAVAIVAVVTRLEDAGKLRAGLSRAAAVDALSALLTIAPAAELVVKRGWSADAAAAMLCQAARAVLLSDAAQGNSPSSPP